jgi:hypothetical protein
MPNSASRPAIVCLIRGSGFCSPSVSLPRAADGLHPTIRLLLTMHNLWAGRKVSAGRLLQLGWHSAGPRPPAVLACRSMAHGAASRYIDQCEVAVSIGAI